MNPPEPRLRRRLNVRGQVQGVGFRPYVFRLAQQHGLGGWVANDGRGARIEVEGPAAGIAAFEAALPVELPPLAVFTACTAADLPPLGERDFRIVASAAAEDSRPTVTPDVALCQDCRRELFDAGDRRNGYPFITCTNCGPRYSIIRDVPYDRPKTTMAPFVQCPPCQAEYDDPASRRFHAQPNACPACGPALRMVVPSTPPTEQPPSSAERDRRATSHRACHTPHTPPLNVVRAAADRLRCGDIIAMKGIGGYHLACRADSSAAVGRLRERKLRDGKPLAIMVPDLDTAHRLAWLAPSDEVALLSAAAPIVLVPRRDIAGPSFGGEPGNRVGRDASDQAHRLDCNSVEPAAPALAPLVAPGCHTLGLLLPYTPLHYLLFAEGLGPLVMTSANLSGEPLCYRDHDAMNGLQDVADAFLLHDREICRPIDDTVVYSWRERIVPLRRARGYVPQPISVPTLAGAPPILALGGDLKSVVGLLQDGEAILSEHLGDLEHPAAYRNFLAAIARLRQLFDFHPRLLACDLHPRYHSTRYAAELGLPLVPVQHHHAHVASVLAEHGETGPVIGLACDGTGYARDGTIWGGEILLCERGACIHLGGLEPFPLIGGDAAAIETWRPAAALVARIYGKKWRMVWERWAADRHTIPEAAQSVLIARQWEQGAGVRTSSLGRVFDAIAYLLGLCDRNRHEAEAAMAVEAAAASWPEPVSPRPCPPRDTDGLIQIDVAPLVRALVEQQAPQGREVARCAAEAQATLAEALVGGVLAAVARTGVRTVALSGGCFANRLLLEGLVERLEQRQLHVLFHERTPPGDGGLALGQLWVAAWQQRGDR